MISAEMNPLSKSELSKKKKVISDIVMCVCIKVTE